MVNQFLKMLPIEVKDLQRVCDTSILLHFTMLHVFLLGAILLHSLLSHDIQSYARSTIFPFLIILSYLSLPICNI